LVNFGAGGEVIDKRGFKEIGWELVDWIGVALNRDKHLPFLSKILNHRVH
jgi:hypothetical protein